MRSNILTIAVVALVVTFAFGSAVQAQIVYGQPTAGGAQVVYSNWKMERDGTEATISQFFVPVTGFVPIQDNFEVTFFAASSGSSLEALDETMDLNGLSDIRMQANHSFAEDHLLLSVGLNLPTGKKELSLADEYFVLQTLALNYIELPSRRLGEGFGFSIMGGGATVLGEGIRGGIGLMYEYIGEYTPYEGGGDYDPGDMISFNGGVDIERGAWLWAVEGVYSIYLDDKSDGEKTFRQSPQTDLRFRARRKSSSASFSLLLRYVMRGDNKDFDIAGVELDPFKLYGDEFFAGAGLGFNLSESLSMTPSLQIRMIGENDVVDERVLGDASVFGFGTMFGWKLSPSVLVDLGGKYFTGKADGDSIDLTGYQLTVGLTATI